MLTLVKIGGAALFIGLLLPVVVFMNRVVDRAPFGALLIVLVGVAIDVTMLLIYKREVL